MSEITSTQRLFRNAMASLGAAVNVLTTNGYAGRCGITATAVCSVTDTPPTVLVCINKSSDMKDIFTANCRLCVNILSSAHEDVAKHFAGLTGVEMEQRFRLNTWEYGPNNLPALQGALGNLYGRITESRDIGTHSVLFVEIDQMVVLEGGGLIYFGRHFHKLPAINCAQ